MNINPEYKKLKFGKNEDENWGLVNIYDENNKPTNLIGVRDPLVKFEKLDELLKTKKFVGLSAYQNFPQGIKNIHDNTNHRNNNFIKKYGDKVILWCHCFKDPQNYIPPGIPLLLYSDSDQYAHVNTLYNLSTTVEKKYDFFCSIPNLKWNAWIRGEEIAKKWLNYMADNMNLKIIITK